MNRSGGLCFHCDTSARLSCVAVPVVPVQVETATGSSDGMMCDCTSCRGKMSDRVSLVASSASYSGTAAFIAVY